MSRCVRLLLACAMLAALLAPASSAPRAHAYLALSPAPSASNGGTVLIPLPGGCGGVLPPGTTDPPCCVRGYVFIDGQAVEGARVTVSSSHGSIEAWTGYGPDSTHPYYRISLSSTPLSLQVGDSVTITAEYSSHTYSINHKVLSGGQQVDVVLPHADDDYAFERQIWQQAPSGQFNYRSGASILAEGAGTVAVDGSGNVYVIDRLNARIQVFDKTGQYLRQWGTLGDEPGQFTFPSGIAVDRLGYVYVADRINHRIQKFTINGKWEASWNLSPLPAGPLSLPVGIAVESDDVTGATIHIYVTDSTYVRKLNPDGSQLAIWDGQGQFQNLQGIAVDHQGNIYVADGAKANPPQNGNHRVYKLNSAGNIVTNWGGWGNGTGQFTYPSGVAVDSDNNIYVADGKYGGYDGGNHRIQKFTSNGGYLASFGGPGHASGQLYFPEGVALDSEGNIYVADAGNHRLQKFAKDGALGAIWGAEGSTNGQFNTPTGVALDANGNLYVADALNQRIQKFRSDGTFLSSWGSQGSASGQLETPVAIALDTSGDVYIADAGNNRIQKFDSDGHSKGSWDGTSSGAGAFKPVGIVVSGTGNIYVTDNLNHRVLVFSGDGVLVHSWGSQGTGNTQFNDPEGIAVGGDGAVYVVDYGNNRVVKFTASGNYMTQWGNVGQASGQFYQPVGIALDAAGDVYVTDSGNRRIQKFTSTGGLLAVWGERGGGRGQLDAPEGLTVDGGGKVYVADTVNNRIQVFHPLTYTRPIATIVKVAPRSVAPGQAVQLVGMGSDSDSTPALASYQWMLDGSSSAFATSATATLPTNDLAPGTHTITFEVKDTEGEFSDPQLVTIDVGGRQEETWTFLLYLDGDNSGDPYLNRDTPLGALYRLEHAAPNPNVNVAVLYDGARSDGDSFYYLWRRSGEFSQVPKGEVDMGDPQTLISFVAWAKQQATADHYYLSIADHANALDGIAWDVSANPVDHLSNADLRNALGAITENGAHPIDILHLDGCLMGSLEVADQVRGLVNYLVSSENLAWSAFAYDTYRRAVGSQTSPAALAAAIIDRYGDLVGEDGLPYTIAALDLGQLTQVVSQTDTLSAELIRFALESSTNRATLAALRGQVQTLDSGGNGALEPTDEYVDLAHWADLVQSRVSDSAVRAAAAALRTGLSGLVLRERHQSGILVDSNGTSVMINLDRTNGVSIYYPPRHGVKTYETYVGGDLIFPQETRWDEYLAAELTALPFDPTLPAPNPVAPLPLRARLFLPLIVR